MTRIPQTMPAVAYRKSLPVEDAESPLDVTLPVPEPGPRDLLVQVEAVAVTPVDHKVRQNNDPDGEPKVLGWDAAGTVVAVGGEVTSFRVGDEVFYAGALDRPGSNSRFHVVDERLVGRRFITTQIMIEMGSDQPAPAGRLQRAHCPQQRHAVGTPGNGQQHGDVVPCFRRPDGGQCVLDRVQFGHRGSTASGPGGFMKDAASRCAAYTVIGPSTR